MNKKDIMSQAERYKQEMMKLYGKNAVPAVNTRPEAAPEKAPEAVPEPEKEIQTEPEDTTVNDAGEEETAGNTPDNFEERYPEPDLSELETDFGQNDGETPQTVPEYATEEDLGSSVGYILVNVRTGDDSEPVENAVVSVTAIIGGTRLVLATGITDESGKVRTIQVPAPDITFSQAPNPSERPYSLYDISVTANGFFNARSVDVPVFSGITSVQNFSMIPVPLFMRSSQETVTNYNQQPGF